MCFKVMMENLLKFFRPLLAHQACSQSEENAVRVLDCLLWNSRKGEGKKRGPLHNATVAAMTDLMVFSPSDQTLVGQVLLIDLAEVVGHMDDACFCRQSHHENQEEGDEPDHDAVCLLTPIV